MQNYFVKLKIDKRQDKQICHYFINSKIDDFDFGKERVVDLHPALGPVRLKTKTEMNKAIDKYTDDYYVKNREEIIKAKLEIFEAWKEIEEEYFKEVQKLFDNKVKLNDKDFICYLSIFACSPLIEPQGWQIYYKIKDKAEIRRLFAHEIMHFFYYSYIKSNREVKSFYKKLEDNDYWMKAEIFNVMALNDASFRKIIGKKEEGYDIHRKYFKKCQSIWKNSGNLNEYLIKVAQLKLE